MFCQRCGHYVEGVLVVNPWIGNSVRAEMTGASRPVRMRLWTCETCADRLPDMHDLPEIKGEAGGEQECEYCHRPMEYRDRMRNNEAPVCPSCRGNWLAEKHAKPLRWINCGWCGAKFSTRKDRQKYCGLSCQDHAARAKSYAKTHG